MHMPELNANQQQQFVSAALSEAADALARLRADEKKISAIGAGAQLLIDAFASDNRVFSCGNGGSMCDAMHFAEELSGRWRKNRRAFGALSISDVSHMSCVANDFGYDAVFSRYLEGWGRAGDVLVAISTSGTSKNILKACEAAKSLNMRILSLTGREGSAIGALADVDICTPGGVFADRTQELHIKVIHILIELTERALCPENHQ
jgi:D-sedoheptulose 7-phosphate isomerase